MRSNCLFLAIFHFRHSARFVACILGQISVSSLCLISLTLDFLNITLNIKVSSRVLQKDQGIDLQSFAVWTRLRVLQAVLSREEPYRVIHSLVKNLKFFSFRHPWRTLNNSSSNHFLVSSAVMPLNSFFISLLVKNL